MASKDPLQQGPDSYAGKRLIMLCDGTWKSKDNGYHRPSKADPSANLQVPSNVTRISRLFKRRCRDGKSQIISYDSGVGTGSNTLDSITGGAFGLGLAERVRECYSYISANYMDGDEIILVGFSRGAFTVRSVAGIISNIGLLTRKGSEHFYPIWNDIQNWMNEDYKDSFPDVPFAKKPRGPTAEDEYRSRLEEMGFTRVKKKDGDLITVKAVCVWDTVGSLGIPRVAWLERLGIRADNDHTFKWHDTALSNRIEHAFHALALDETRPSFVPALWERRPQDDCTTDLRQVWFPGAHSNCGGGKEDQNIANCSLAWMMDQMASVGVEFHKESFDRALQQSISYYQSSSVRKTLQEAKKKKRPNWAVPEIYQGNSPVRPWGLGSITSKNGILYKLSGTTARHPGQYRHMDPKTERDEGEWLQDTNERIHSSVRVRLACQGLSLNDESVWKCSALSKWELKRSNDEIKDPVPKYPEWDPDAATHNGETAKDAAVRRNKHEPQTSQHASPLDNSSSTNNGRWVWEYCGPEKDAPPDPRQRRMVEEPLGPYERYVVKVTGGSPNVYDFAEKKSQKV